MSFNSVEYFLFLPLVFLMYRVAGENRRWIVLLVASYVFYACFGAPQTLAALVLVTFVSYWIGRNLGKVMESRFRSLIFWLGAASCILILAVVKYLPASMTTLAASSPFAFLLNSVGVSYFVLQAVSYMADVYLEKQIPETHPGIHALSLAFFPKIAQGPIERASDILPQLHKPKPFDYDSARRGILLFAFGLAKKVVIADQLAMFADAVYRNPRAYTGLPILVATYAYALQIYFDFSGYTDMARGSARLFGIELRQNFQSPYLAVSIPEFWRRWHISFSRWILDYIFTPLQMLFRNIGKAGTALALLAAFLLSGVWHGAKAGFIVWGALHGIYLAASVFYAPFRKKWQKRHNTVDRGLAILWRRFITFNLVCLAWIFFRANSLDDAFYLAAHALDVKGSLDTLRRTGLSEYIRQFILVGNGGFAFLAVILSLAVYLVIRRMDPETLFRQPAWIRWCAYSGIVLGLLVLAAPASQFIYFQF